MYKRFSLYTEITEIVIFMQHSDQNKSLGYLGNQTGHLVAVELVRHIAVDVDRHFE